MFEMELVSNPTINLNELKEAIKNGTVKNVKIIDTVSGEVTTVGELANGMKDILERQEIILDKNSVLCIMLKSLE
jgi:glycerate-2-kinase